LRFKRPLVAAEPGRPGSG